MGFGSTAKKLQRVTDLADEVYDRLSTLHDQIASLRDTVEETNDRVSDLEAELADQRTIIDELARKQGIDPERLTTRSDADATDSDETTDDAAATEVGPDTETG